jgi:lysozyme family protein
LDNNFERAFALVVKAETKTLSLDPKDRGNWTGGKVGAGELKGSKYGISAASFPDEDIANMTLERAKFLAKSKYWDRVHGDALAWPVNVYLFDDDYNSGEGVAVRQLQRTLGLFCDGVVGPITVDAANRMNDERKADFLAKRGFEESLIATWPRYGEGWLKRIILLAQAGVTAEDPTP